jgi:hypothetical protein
MRSTIVRLADLANRCSPSSPPDGAFRTLHIRCGHDIMEKLARAGFTGDFLCFADPYVHGPVPRAPSREAFVRVRAAFIESRGFAVGVFDELYAAYRDLDRAVEYDSVNIWMEHDSYDQLILAKLLAFFSDAEHRPAQLRFISVSAHPGVGRFIGLGQLDPEALRSLWDTFQDVSEAHLGLGREAWDAITEPTPLSLAELISTGTPELPTLGGALARHIQELPATRNGLSLTETLTLEILARHGPMSATALFRRYTNDYEPLPFMGDSGYWPVLRDLAGARQAAVRLTGEAATRMEERGVALLPFGERVLRGDADWLHANDVERWVGGVRIDSRERVNWRVDDQRRARPDL